MKIFIKKIDFRSYKTILIAGFILRIVAAIFSKGYGMHDDHFLTIEASSSWTEGRDYNKWLPNEGTPKNVPQGHSFTYVGLNFFLFKCLKTCGIHDPQVLMMINRLLHGIFSLLVIYFGIRITEKLSNKNNAITVGWLLALLWAMPFLSVRNLVEITSIPFLMWGVWLMLNYEKKFYLLYSGLLIGMAISFRYQIAIFAIATAGYYFFKSQYKFFFQFCIGVISTFVATQGIVDFIIWGKPFTEFIAYSTYNMNEGTKYLPNSNYFMYFWVLMGILLVPLGILMAIGFFNSAKKYAILFIPTLAFILFHTFFPNRQERFILTILPFFIILGVLGYEVLLKKTFWRKFWKTSLVIFWIINIPILLILSLTYSKKSRVEATYALYGKIKANERILLEGSYETKPSMLPLFYCNNWDVQITERNDTIQSLEVFEGAKYNYIFFFGEEKLDSRINDYKRLYPNIKLVKKCPPSTVDLLLRKLNSRNANQYIEVWETNI
jgi:hypothetical protein